MTAASAALSASSVQPEGAESVTAEGSWTQGLFNNLRKIAAGFTKRAAATTIEILKPSNIVVPGGSAAVNAAAKASNAGSAVVSAGAKAVAAAGSGIKTGFTLGIAGVILLLFLFLRHNLK